MALSLNLWGNKSAYEIYQGRCEKKGAELCKAISAETFKKSYSLFIVKDRIMQFIT